MCRGSLWDDPALSSKQARSGLWKTSCAAPRHAPFDRLRSCYPIFCAIRHARWLASSAVYSRGLPIVSFIALYTPVCIARPLNFTASDFPHRLLRSSGTAAATPPPPPPALLRRGEGREAAEHFRDEASRTRILEDIDQGGASEGQGDRTKGQRTAGGGSVDAAVARARLSRMQAVGVAMAGDGSSAEILLRGGLQELRAGLGVGGMSSEKEEEEGLTQAALGSLLAQGR